MMDYWNTMTIEELERELDNMEEVYRVFPEPSEQLDRFNELYDYIQHRKKAEVEK